MNKIPETLNAGFKQIRADYGVSQAQVLAAYARYHPQSGRKMLLSEFMALGLWQHKTVPDGFIGTREASEFALSVNFQPHKRGMVADKLLFDAALRGLGFPVPTLQAVFGAKKLRPPVQTLGHKGEVAQFLRQGASYPVFGKPRSGQNSDDVISIERYDPQADILHMTTGKTALVDEIAGQIAPAYFRRGFLFQSRIRQHESICDTIGEAVGTVRIITFLTAAQPRIIGAFWKIPRHGMLADNLWRGGLLAAVDTKTGQVGRAREGTGPMARWHQAHPDTGAALANTTLPDWDDLRELVSDAAALLGGLPLVGWDVALTKTGPIIVEANTVPSLDLLQYGTGAPALPPALRAEMLAEVARLKRQSKTDRAARKANLRAKVRGRLARAFGIGQRR